jgi:DNA-binding response OmpR family regulator
MAQRMALLCSSSTQDQEALRNLLSESGFRMATAVRTADALIRISEHQFEMLLLDLDLNPRWRAVLEVLGAEVSYPPVIAYSRDPGSRWRLDALEAGAYDIIGKPFVGEELHWVLRTAVLRSKVRRSAELLAWSALNPPGSVRR